MSERDIEKLLQGRPPVLLQEETEFLPPELVEDDLAAEGVWRNTLDLFEVEELYNVFF